MLGYIFDILKTSTILQIYESLCKFKLDNNGIRLETQKPSFLSLHVVSITVRYLTIFLKIQERNHVKMTASKTIHRQIHL